jgi:hypothetical protein
VELMSDCFTADSRPLIGRKFVNLTVANGTQRPNNLVITSPESGRSRSAA